MTCNFINSMWFTSVSAIAEFLHNYRILTSSNHNVGVEFDVNRGERNQKEQVPALLDWSKHIRVTQTADRPETRKLSDWVDWAAAQSWMSWGTWVEPGWSWQQQDRNWKVRNKPDYLGFMMGSPYIIYIRSLMLAWVNWNVTQRDC